MVRLFSHEVTDVEPVLGMLSQQNPQDHEVHTCQLLLSIFGFNVVGIYLLTKQETWLTYTMLLLSYRKTRGSLGEREMLWEHKPYASDSFLEFSHTFMNVSITQQRHREHEKRETTYLLS